MPAHTHDSRTECFLYLDLPEDARVAHRMGEREETRHLLVAEPASGHLALVVAALRRGHRGVFVRVGDGR